MHDQNSSTTRLSNRTSIAAVVAAAGLSRRMGQPKQLLPWNERTVIEAVVWKLAEGGADPVVCVVGHRGEEVQGVLTNTSAHVVFNPDYLTGEMLSSYQAGIRFLQQSERENVCDNTDPIRGTLLSLCDQPHIPIDVIRQVTEQARSTPEQIVIPSYAMRRGHPFYLPHSLWTGLLTLGDNETLRDLINRHADQIIYVNVDSDAILRDMDTPADYEEIRKGQNDDR